MEKYMKKNRSIVLASYYFYPENVPRAFRATEIAKGLAKAGYKVKVYIPDYSFDYNSFEKQHNIKIVKVPTGILLNKHAKKNLNQAREEKSRKFFFLTSIKNIIYKIYKMFYLGGSDFEYCFTLAKMLKKENENDKLISIGLPFSVHLGVYFAQLLNKNIANVFIADYGDPFSTNPDSKSILYYHHKLIEKLVLKKFDYVTIPIKKARTEFSGFKENAYIKIIPQGLDFSQIKLAKYQKNKIIDFAYAGLFYKKIRNPDSFFMFLVQQCSHINFKFTIFTNTKDNNTMYFIHKYRRQLGAKIEVVNLLPREECIFRLSSFDFLINIENLNSVQQPSKLIDYTLAKRPVFSFSQLEIDYLKLTKMLNGDLHGNFRGIDLEKYNIDYTIQAFSQLEKPILKT